MVLLQEGFSPSSVLTSGTRSLFVVGGGSAHFRMVSSNSGLYPLDASSSPSPKSSPPKMSSDVAQCPLGAGGGAGDTTARV